MYLAFSVGDPTISDFPTSLSRSHIPHLISPSSTHDPESGVRIWVSTAAAQSYSLPGSILLFSSNPLPRRRAGQMPLFPGARMPLGSNVSLSCWLNLSAAFPFQLYTLAI